MSSLRREVANPSRDKARDVLDGKILVLIGQVMCTFTMHLLSSRPCQ